MICPSNDGLFLFLNAQCNMKLALWVAGPLRLHSPHEGLRQHESHSTAQPVSQHRTRPMHIPERLSYDGHTGLGNYIRDAWFSSVLTSTYIFHAYPSYQQRFDQWTIEHCTARVCVSARAPGAWGSPDAHYIQPLHLHRARPKHIPDIPERLSLDVQLYTQILETI